MANVTKMQAHVAGRHAAATAAGRPILRTNAPGIITLPGDSVYIARLDAKTGRLELLDTTNTNIRHSINVAELAAFILEDGYQPSTNAPSGFSEGEDEDQAPSDDPAESTSGPATGAYVIFPDRATLARTRQAVAHLCTSEGGFAQMARRTRRVIDVAQACPVQGRIAVLTDALAAKFWSPTGMATNNLSAWANAFDLAGTPLRFAMVSLVELATGYQGDEAANPANRVRVAHYHALKSAWFGSSGMSAVKAYRSLARMQTSWTGVLQADPAAEERNVLQGVVSRWNGTAGTTSTTATGEVSQPFVIKPGRTVEVYAQGDPVRVLAKANVKAVTVAGDGTDRLILTLSFTPAEGAKMRYGAALMVREPPFSMRPSKTRGDAWMGSTQPLPVIPEREVSLDVILAGAPTA